MFGIRGLVNQSGLRIKFGSPVGKLAILCILFFIFYFLFLSRRVQFMAFPQIKMVLPRFKHSKSTVNFGRSTFEIVNPKMKNVKSTFTS